LGEAGWFDPAHVRPIKRTVSVIPGSSRNYDDSALNVLAKLSALSP